jgi:hypothetical protein
MRALVIYESMFGNTMAVAQSIADGIGTRVPAELVEVAAAPTEIPPDVALIVVGGPTHAHGLSKPDSRADAARRAGDRLVSRGIGIREWLDELQQPASPTAVAAYTTRIKGPGLLWGSAAKAIAKRLVALRFRSVVPAEDFLIGGPTGPLFDRVETGELERARTWGAELAAAVAEPVHAR